MSYEHLNRAIKEFTFKGTDCNDKPGHISEGLSIGGRAMQNFCLLRLIPLFVFDVVDFAFPIWALLLLLKEVVELWTEVFLNGFTLAVEPSIAMDDFQANIYLIIWRLVIVAFEYVPVMIAIIWK